MVYIIAEIGNNHNGDVELAKKMADAAIACGVDAIKFQTFIASELIAKSAPKAEYQIATTGNEESQLEMVQRLEFTFDDYLVMKEYCEAQGVDVFSTAFDMTSLDFLISTGMAIYKVPSGEITNLPYLEKIGQQQKKVILSTGMATLDEIKAAVAILEKNGSTDITILHCTTDYPTQDEDVNMEAMVSLQTAFKGYNIGYSDHSLGTIAAIMATALGARVVEKHFTTDNTLPGPDQKASAMPDVMAALVEGVRRAERMLGDGNIVPTPTELDNRIVARKSIVAKTDIQKGDVFTLENLTVKRPGSGISPMHWYEVLGQVADKDYTADDLIVLESIGVQ